MIIGVYADLSNVKKKKSSVRAYEWLTPGFG
jgi:hypothetical protein